MRVLLLLLLTLCHCCSAAHVVLHMPHKVECISLMMAAAAAAAAAAVAATAAAAHVPDLYAALLLTWSSTCCTK
jgi:hypothetical protein